MSDYEEYGLEPATVHLLNLFSNGCEAKEAGRSSRLEAKEAATFLRFLDADERAMVIMDMLVLIYTLESEVIDLKLKEMSVE